jgi:hypothetical protein
MERALSGRVFAFRAMVGVWAMVPALKQGVFMSQLESRKYVSFSHTFADPWTGETAEDAQDVTLAFRFAKPTKTQIQRLQDKAAKNAGQASRNLVLDCVHPDDKQALSDAMDEYPGIATSFATAIIKGVGISAELGN